MARFSGQSLHSGPKSIMSWNKEMGQLIGFGGKNRCSVLVRMNLRNVRDSYII